MKKFIIATLLASASLYAQAAETIRFAMEASYPPFEVMDKQNQMQGFDVDLAKALCQEIKADCTFTNQGFDSLIPSLKFRRFDAIISAMDITPDRKKQVSFTESYYENSALFVAAKGKVTDVAALKGKRVGVQNGTTHQKYLADKHPEITAVPYDNYQNAALDMKNNRLDAVFGDTAVIDEWLKQNENFVKVGDKITDPNYFGIGLGIAVRQNNEQLLTQLNTALATLKQNGTYQAIYKKWFQQ